MLPLPVRAPLSQRHRLARVALSVLVLVSLLVSGVIPISAHPSLAASSPHIVLLTAPSA
jgi:hypothetical protein